MNLVEKIWARWDEDLSQNREEMEEEGRSRGGEQGQY